MDQQFRKAEYLRGKIEMLKARKQDLLGRASALEIYSAAGKQLAETLDEVIARLHKYTAELAELEPEA